MLDSTLLTPKELHADLLFLKSRGFESKDLSRLHHLSRGGRTISLAQAISYFERRGALRGNNIELAVRCHYVAEQIRSGHANLRSLISEALGKWPLKRGSRAAKPPPRKAQGTTRLRSAAKKRKRR